MGLNNFRYDENLKTAKAVGIKKGLTTGLSLGSVFLIMFSTYGLAFWYGSELVFNGEPNFDLGTMLTTFFAVLIGAFSLGGVRPFFLKDFFLILLTLNCLC